MAEAEVEHWKPDTATTLWLTASLALVLAPHVSRIPLWITACFVVLALWRVEHAVHGVRLPGRALRVFLSLAVVAGVFASYGTLFGRNAGVAALAVLAGMKLLETDSLRDAYAGCFLGYFLVITSFLYSQSIQTGVYMAVVVTVMTATLVTINTPAGRRKPRKATTYALTLLAQALPITIALFVLFPRVPGPLWGLPKDALSATSGLSDTMSPGSISQLGLSSAVAFRVEFEGPIPPTSKLYWRGPVLSYTDGRNWSAPQSHSNRRLPAIEERGDSVAYSVTLEPHRQPWIFALDVPATLPPQMRATDEYQLLAPGRVKERIRYRLRSYPDAIMERLTASQRRLSLHLPGESHPEAKALAGEWRAESTSPSALIERALRHFRTEPFYYTLRPPLLLGDPVDEFLFGSRRGFCEHYAAAFVVLMRAAGVPARVVTGYQGGDVNPLGDYVIVRQRDAHAWAEVWVQGRGWVRADPTAAVSPQRIELGMDAAIPSSIGPEAFSFQPTGAVARFFRSLRHGWDMVNNSWNQWVLAYGPGRQRDVLAALGLEGGDWKVLSMVLLACVSALFVVLGLWVMRRRRHPDPVVRAYARFCAKLARRGMERDAAEGPWDFHQRIVAWRPELEQPARRVTSLYVGIRYAGHAESTGELEQAVAAFRP